MSQYAQKTEVPIDRSKAEIEKTLERYGADQFYFGWDKETGRVALGFRIECRQVRVILPMPDIADFRLTTTGRARTASSQRTEWEQACKQRWRALALVIKAKLEAVECGISTIEREFLADVLLPNGMTFHQWAAPQLIEAYEGGHMPPLLPA